MLRTLKNLLRNAFLPAMAAAALFAFSSKATAQNVYGGLHFLAAVPHGDFYEHVKRTGFGLGGQFGYHIDNTPLMVGLDAGVMIYGSDERREPFSNTIPDVTVKVTTSNNIAQGHLFLRLQPQEGAVRPYVDGLVGFNYLFTSTTISNEGREDDEVASSTNYDDAALSYGGGAGMLIRLYENTDVPSPSMEGEGSVHEVLLDLGVRYISGGEAGYLTGGAIRRENGKVSYDVTHSRTDLISGRVGVMLRF